MEYLPLNTARAEAADGIDVAEIVRTLRRQWRAVVVFTALGVLTAGGVMLFAPRRFEGRASLLARSASSEGGASILGRLSNIGSLMSGGALGGLPAPFESELQILRSRTLAGRVVDSLQLQFSVRDPARNPPLDFVSASDLPGRFEPRKYHFERDGAGTYVVRHEGKTYRFVPGQAASLDIGSITLSRTAKLPPSFVLKVFDREESISRLLDRLTASKAGGEVARLVYRGEDSTTAAAVPNLVMNYYLDRRKTVDRGTNQRRLEFVTEELGETGKELASTERALRQYQEASGVLDAEVEGKAWIEGAVALRESLTTVLVEENTIKTLIDRTASGAMSAQQLAAYPAFLRGSSIGVLQGHLSDLQAQRISLLDRRTERDPDVVVIDNNIKSLETQILGLARSYANSITEQRKGYERQIDSLQKHILALPAAAERGGRLQRDVLRLSTIFTAVQAQLVEAKLAAIGEGGDVKPIDLAVPPRKPAFPLPFLTMGLGTFGGLVTGCVAALMLGWFGRWLRDPVEIERATGISAQSLDAEAPLLFAGTAPRSVLVVPLAAGALAAPVAQRLAHTSTARALRTQILDLSAAVNGNGAGQHTAEAITRLESETDMLIVQLPSLSAEITVAALRDTRPVLFVAPPGPVDRARLASALGLLRRLGVPCAGVVISEATRKTLRA